MANLTGITLVPDISQGGGISSGFADINSGASGISGNAAGSTPSNALTDDAGTNVLADDSGTNILIPG